MFLRSDPPKTERNELVGSVLEMRRKIGPTSRWATLEINLANSSYVSQLKRRELDEFESFFGSPVREVLSQLFRCEKVVFKEIHDLIKVTFIESELFRFQKHLP